MTRVAPELGAMPIQIDSIGRLHAERLGRHSNGGALLDGNDRRRDNFSATRVRFFFTPLGSPPARAYRSLDLRRAAQPMPLLALSTPTSALHVMATIDAVHLAAIASPAKMKKTPTIVDYALNLPQIVHSRVRPLGIRPPRGIRATTLASNASTRGDRGLGAGDSGPFFFKRSRGSSAARLKTANYATKSGCSDFRAFMCPSTLSPRPDADA
jgi:hypothetical protein